MPPMVLDCFLIMGNDFHLLCYSNLPPPPLLLLVVEANKMCATEALVIVLAGKNLW